MTDHSLRQCPPSSPCRHAHPRSCKPRCRSITYAKNVINVRQSFSSTPCRTKCASATSNECGNAMKASLTLVRRLAFALNRSPSLLDSTPPCLRPHCHTRPLQPSRLPIMWRTPFHPSVSQASPGHRGSPHLQDQRSLMQPSLLGGPPQAAPATAWGDPHGSLPGEQRDSDTVSFRH